MTSIQEILNDKREKLAFIVGNGINRHDHDKSPNSWDSLLLKLWNMHPGKPKSSVPAGISITEFYDVLEIRRSRKQSKSIRLQKEFCDLMKKWRYRDHHLKFVTWAKNNSCPILTTNFENTLGDAISAKLHKLGRDKFTDYYPWSTYYSNLQIKNAASEFAIWHINGMQKYYRSIRLGLSHYMGSVQRARGWLHRGNQRRLFSVKNQQNWRGRDSWLHIIFNNDLLVFGLGLEQNEVFLRWLLIERAKYFNKFRDRRREAWYLYRGPAVESGKLLFLKSIGVVPISVQTYDEIYVGPWQIS